MIWTHEAYQSLKLWTVKPGSSPHWLKSNNVYLLRQVKSCGFVELISQGEISGEKGLCMGIDSWWVWGGTKVFSNGDGRRILWTGWKQHWIVHCKWINCLVSEVCLNKPVTEDGKFCGKFHAWLSQERNHVWIPLSTLAVDIWENHHAVP